MEQDRFVVLDNKKGVAFPLQEKQTDISAGLKAEKLEKLLKLLMKQTVCETIKEYHFILREEWKESEDKLEHLVEQYRKEDAGRWKEREERLEHLMEKYRKEDVRRWKELESHFRNVDRLIREKQIKNKKI